MQHALLIVNPHSKNGHAEALKEAVQLIENTGIKISVHESKSESHMISLIKDYQRDDGLIIIAGGDGTISSALESILNSQQTLAIFPMGTANDFARSIGVPENLLAAAQIIIDGKRKRMNLGKVNNRFFMNVAHLGLGVDVTHELSPESKKYFGVLAYFGAFIQAIKRNKSFKVHIKSDDWHYSTRAIHLAIGNGRYYGGGNIVDENSTLFDGTLNLFCIKAQPWWRLLLLSPKLRNGNLQTAERIVCKAAEKFSIKTSKPRELEADGELKTKTPAEFQVIPEAIEVIVGDTPMTNTENH